MGIYGDEWDNPNKKNNAQTKFLNQLFGD